jgi:Ca2+-binding EF-hand superfamily protein
MKYPVFSYAAIRILCVIGGMAAGVSLAQKSFAADSADVVRIPTAAAEQFQMMDSNKDGKVTPLEHADGAKRMFQSMDADKDGRVTAIEMDAVQPKAKPGESRSAPGKPQSLSSAEKIKVVDANKDGVLTADEHAEGSRNMFKELDADSDGALTLAELRAGHDKHHVGKTG